MDKIYFFRLVSKVNLGSKVNLDVDRVFASFEDTYVCYTRIQEFMTE